jgi:hypothetical protein
MALSPNYGWAEPDNSSLVKNGAQDIRALGDAIDTSVWNVGYGQAGKNKIINGDFSIWQRGTSFSPIGSDNYCADRWWQNTGNNTDNYVTRQTFTPGTAPVAGYENAFYLRWVTTPAGSGGTFKNFLQRVEDVRVFAGQTCTLSFWAKADAARDVVTSLQQNFGSGGSTSVSVTGATHTLTTSWARYSVTFSVPSITGKTIGTSSFLRVNFSLPLNTAMTIEFFGVQLEYGAKMTPFQTASGGSPQAELAMCQRYYYRFTGVSTGFLIASMGNDASSTTAGQAHVKLPVTMRTIPSTLDTAGTWFMSQYAGSSVTLTALTWNSSTSQDVGVIGVTAASGLVTTSKYQLLANNSTASYVGFSAEL